MPRLRARLGLWMTAIFVGLGVGTTVAVLRTTPFGVVVSDGHVERLMDFASHRAFACAAWADRAASPRSIYTVRTHLQATEDWTGIPSEIALPFGYAPTMLWILGPFCWCSERTAFVAWSLLGMLAVVVAVTRARVPWSAQLTLLTAITVYTIALGQTALLSTAGILFLLSRDREDGDTRQTSGVSVMVLWLLTAKPPLAFAAGVALLARGKWRLVVLALVVTIGSTLALRPWLGSGWWRDYLGLLAQYDSSELPQAFAWSIRPELMSNLRAALHVDLGSSDARAAHWSGAIWLISSIVAVCVTWARARDWSAAWSLSLMCFLLFCPHLSASEDLALVCVLTSLNDDRHKRSFVLFASLVAFGGLLLSPAIGPLQGTRPSMLFLAKLAILILAIGLLLPSRAPRA